MDDVFHLETCRALVALSDEDKSGRLNFDEFKQIWLGVRSWIETFLKFDQGTFNMIFSISRKLSQSRKRSYRRTYFERQKDLSKSFSTFELRAALAERGYRISTQLLGILIIRYASGDGSSICKSCDTDKSKCDTLCVKSFFQSVTFITCKMSVMSPSYLMISLVISSVFTYK